MTDIVITLMTYRRLWITASVLLAFKIYYKFSVGRCLSKRRLDGKTAIVTGGNSGIGREAARDLARRGAKVILACRNIDKANAVRDDIIRTTGNNKVEVWRLDLSSLNSVREFAERVNSTEPALHILVNNAGIPGNNGKRTKDGLEFTMQVNHLGHFLLTNLLLDLMKRSAPARVVFVASLMHAWFEKLDPEDLRHDKMIPFNNVFAYSNTKLCNVLTAAHMGEMLKGTGVTVNSLHPGAVMTEIWERMPSWVTFLARIIIGSFMKDSVEGAQTTIHVAVAEEVEGITGKYFSDCQVVKPSKRARDVDLARRVWDSSCHLVGLSTKTKDQAAGLSRL